MCRFLGWLRTACRFIARPCRRVAHGVRDLGRMIRAAPGATQNTAAIIATARSENTVSTVTATAAAVNKAVPVALALVAGTTVLAAVAAGSARASYSTTTQSEQHRVSCLQLEAVRTRATQQQRTMVVLVATPGAALTAPTIPDTLYYTVAELSAASALFPGDRDYVLFLFTDRPWSIPRLELPSTGRWRLIGSSRQDGQVDTPMVTIRQLVAPLNTPAERVHITKEWTQKQWAVRGGLAVAVAAGLCWWQQSICHWSVQVIIRRARQEWAALW